MPWELLLKVPWGHSRNQKILFRGIESRFDVKMDHFCVFSAKIGNLRPILRAELIFVPNFMIYALGIKQILKCQ